MTTVDTKTDFEVVIGLEVHSQLLTKSKMFCGCDADYQRAEPNTLVCEVCMGMPGVLPVINRRAVELVIATGLAVNCTIPRHTKFDRKNYPYPDLMKGYQISQFDMPIAKKGSLEVDVDGTPRTVRIERVHLEEDVAKLMHRTEPDGTAYSLLDINRAGVPLMEIVSEPDIRSPEEARAYLVSLRSILRYIDVSTANMEEGSFRCDANISIRPRGAEELGSKVEVKNMNSFRSVYSALVYETDRQTRLALEGQHITQETRGWMDDRQVTVSQRTKEYASDYRYFPEPDLPPLEIDPEWVDDIRSRLPELPAARKARFVSEYALSDYDADLLTASRTTADYFESVMDVKKLEGEKKHERAKAIGNWVLGEMARLLNAADTTIDSVNVQPGSLVALVEMVDDGTLSSNMAKELFEEMFNNGGEPKALAEAKGLVQVSSADDLMPAVEEALGNNPSAVDDYRGGKETALRFLVGQVMKATRGKANPQLAEQLLKQKLDE